MKNAGSRCRGTIFVTMCRRARGGDPGVSTNHDGLGVGTVRDAHGVIPVGHEAR
jgi:hypothetical protein